MVFNIFSKYRKLPLNLKASFWFMFATFLQRGLTAITTPIFTRIMTDVEYGQYSVYSSWLGIIAILATFNFSYGVYNNAMIKFRNHRSEYTSAIETLSLIITFLCYIIYLVFKDSINLLTGLDTKLFTLMFVQIGFMPIIAFWNTRERFENRYKKLVVITLLISLSIPFLGILLIVNFENNLMMKVISQSIIYLLFGIYFLIYQFKKGKKLFKWEYWKYALIFNLPLIPHYLSSVILNNSDRILINYYIGSIEAGIYNVAYSAAMLVTILISAINSAYIPWTYGKMEKKDYSEINITAILFLYIVGFSILILIGFAPEIIYVLAPEQYYDAVWIIPPVALSALFMFIINLFGNIEFFYEKSFYVLISSLFASTLNVILNILLIPKYGYIAAGYTTLFSYFIMVLLHYMFMKITLVKKNVTSKIYNIKIIVVISIIYLILGLTFIEVYEFSIIRYLIIIVITIIATLIYYRHFSLKIKQIFQKE